MQFFDEIRRDPQGVIFFMDQIEGLAVSRYFLFGAVPGLAVADNERFKTFPVNRNTFDAVGRLGAFDTVSEKKQV